MVLIRKMPEDLRKWLIENAGNKNRSLSEEINLILENHRAHKPAPVVIRGTIIAVDKIAA